jgi:1-acyl-sn-glycerol-3-phosphate acyltransferase
MAPLYTVISWAARVFFRLGYGVRLYGLDQVPVTGKAIFASNHRSDFDPPILGGFIPREVHFFAKEELFRHKVFGAVIRAVNAFPVRRGQFDREALSGCLDILKRDRALLFYPEGTRAPADGFLKAKLGLGWVAVLSEAPVVPVYIHGSTVLKPWKGKRPNIHVVFGKPIPAADLRVPELRGKEEYQAISDRILNEIRRLSLTVPGVTDIGPIYDRTVIKNERLR